MKLTIIFENDEKTTASNIEEAQQIILDAHAAGDGDVRIILDENDNEYGCEWSLAVVPL